MANIEETSGWPDVPLLATRDLVLGGVDGPSNAQAIALTARTNLLQDNQKRTPLHFATLAEATAAAAGIYVDGVVEVARDESRTGLRTRYVKRSDGSLEFLMHMDQAVMDLKLPSGSSNIGHDTGTVAGALEAQGKAAGIVTEMSTAGTVQDVLDSSVRSTSFRAKIELGQEDCLLLLQGDSTGNENWEFFYKMVVALHQKYPTHSIYYRLWNSTTKSWEQVAIFPGTGPRTIRVYNGSVPGANPIYWQGANKAPGFDGWQFDLVMLNYGLNTGETEQLHAACAMLYNMRMNQISSEIVMVIQPPDYTDASMLARSAKRSEVQRRVASAYGVGVIDAFTLFTRLVNKTGNVDDWYLDKIHPNEAGQAFWAQLSLASVLNTPQKLAQLQSQDTEIPNGNMSRWPNGNSAPPLWWDALSGAAIIRDTVTWETAGGSALASGAGSGGTGIMRGEITEFVNRVMHWPQIVFAARVYATGNYKPGTLSFVKYAPSYTELRGNDNGYQGVGSGGWRWAIVVVPRSFYADAAATQFMLEIFSGESGEHVRVDRIVAGPSLLPPDSNLRDYGLKGVFSYDDDAFTIPAKSYTNRIVSSPRLRKGALLEVHMAARPSTVVLQAHATADGTAQVILTNNGDAVVNVAAQQFDIIIK